jgi:hypothetical protein
MHKILEREHGGALRAGAIDAGRQKRAAPVYVAAARASTISSAQARGDGLRGKTEGLRHPTTLYIDADYRLRVQAEAREARARELARLLRCGFAALARAGERAYAAIRRYLGSLSPGLKERHHE